MSLLDFFTKKRQELGTFTDPRDGTTYQTLEIGQQVWMAENFRGRGWDYNENDNCLYNWASAVQLAPPGWHLPSASDWQALIDFLGGGDVAGGKMKAKKGWGGANTAANNKSGFSALPGGLYDAMGGRIIQRFVTAAFWSASTDNVDSWAKGLFLESESGKAVVAGRQKVCYLSVRYIKNGA